MVLLGVAIGFYAMGTMTEAQIQALLVDYRVYAALFVIACVFTLLFKRVYYSGAEGVNWKATFGSIFGQFVRTIFAIAMTGLLITGFRYITSEEGMQKLKSNKNVKILMKEADSAVHAPKLPGEYSLD